MTTETTNLCKNYVQHVRNIGCQFIENWLQFYFLSLHQKFTDLFCLDMIYKNPISFYETEGMILMM